MTDPLADIRTGGKRAISGALAELEARPEADATIALLDACWRAQSGLAVGFTGPPGVGKSTLLNSLLKAFRARGRTVAVLAVDPSSRASGGALLGDRARMDADPSDQGVFVRSLAARDRLGGLADIAPPAIVLFRALYDLVLIETVGVGQSETEIADYADLVVFLAQPGSGDSLQFMKAGVMEVPDLAVVAKADLGLPARRAAADLKGALSLAVRDRPAPPVLMASAQTGEGVEALADAILDEGLARAGARLDAQRRRQDAAWLAAALRQKFGTEGLRALGPLADDGSSPFLRERAASETLRQRLNII